MIHQIEHPLKGKVVKIKTEANEIGGEEYRIEDYWDRIAGKSWMVSSGNPACLNYAMRTGLSSTPVPTDNEVLYGKINGMGFLVHVSEIENI